MFKKIKKWLERMAERNEKRYGNQKLDCCDMNRESLSPDHKHHKPATAQKK